MSIYHTPNLTMSGQTGNNWSFTVAVRLGQMPRVLHVLLPSPHYYKYTFLFDSGRMAMQKT